MATYYTAVCHTCRQRVSLAGCADSTVAKKTGEWAQLHLTHDISLIHDGTGWDEEYDKFHDKVMQYEEVED